MDSSDDPMQSLRHSQQYRSKHRDRSHASAHTENAPSHSIPQHPLVCREAATVIDSPEKLNELIAHLHTEKSFAYDSEFIGELTYVPKLCLIQVATTKRIALIDPLAGFDFNSFWEAVCDPTLEKIVHAGQQDIEPVFRILNRAPSNIFDTQISAGLAGLAYPVALSKLVEHFVGAKLGKALTFTHWDQRPLSAGQLRYAADDVRYLPALRDALGRQLQERGHTDWAKEECDALCNPTLYQFDPDTAYLRLRGVNSLASSGLAILRELTIWRDQMAREHNLPQRAILRDEILVDMARSPVKNVEKLAKIKGLPRPIEQAHGKELVELTLRALALPAEQMPQVKTHEPGINERFEADALFALTQSLCFSLGIDPALVTSRQEIGQVYRSLKQVGAPPVTRLFTGWRKEAIGDPLLQLLKGEQKFNLQWTGEALRINP